MILQVIFDDQFGNYVLEQFKNYRDRTRIVLLLYSDEKTKYIRDIPQEDIVFYGSPTYNDLLAHLSKYKAVIVHGLFSFIQYDIIRHLPSTVKLAWVFWGAEIYTRQDIYTTYLARYTNIAYRIKQCKDVFLRAKMEIHEVPRDIFSRVDFMLGSSLELFEDVKAYTGNTNMKHLMYSYFTLEHLIGQDLLNQTTNGNNILLGNSATPDNNHLDMMLQLKRIGVPEKSKIITPLSYGIPWVRQIIYKFGRFLFGKQFYPLLEFLPRNEYNKLLQSCSVFITNHHRPNAFGNVLTALWLGARVYSSKDNVQTKFLQRLGLHINIIETDLVANRVDKYAALPDYEREENRTIISGIYGQKNMRRNIETIIRTLDA